MVFKFYKVITSCDVHEKLVDQSRYLKVMGVKLSF
jgi:hypothetical protein